MNRRLLVISLHIILGGCSQSILTPRYHLEKPQSSESNASQPEGGQGGTQSAAPETADSANRNADSAAMGPTAAPANTTAATPATGSVSVTLSIIPPTPAGTYRNRGHIRSIWITDAGDKYIKTIHAFAGVRSINLKRWQVFTNNTADGTTGATQTTPAAGIPINATWDLKDKAGQSMVTGNYKLWLEYVEANTPALDQGKKPSDPMQAIDNVNGYEYMTVPFTLSAQGAMKTDSSNAVFKDVTVKHVP